jgi:microcystin-dependent protein
MADPFIAEVRIFAGTFAPRSWAECDGQLLPIAQNTALFSIISTTYGGDGETTVGLPQLKGRAAMHPGNGPGLSSRRLGQQGGVTSVSLTANQMPEHTHSTHASSLTANRGDPVGASLADVGGLKRYGPANDLEDMNSKAIDNTGGEAHNNMQPYLVLTFIIALVGLFPTRN